MNELGTRSFNTLIQKCVFILFVASAYLLMFPQPSLANSDAKQVASITEKRVALVLGNSTYDHLPDLRNPKNDATDISAALAKLGFTVIDGFDLTRTEMLSVLQEFVDAIADSDVALFYYAGHAIQVNGTSYLIPANAILNNAKALNPITINLNTLLKFVNAKGRKSVVLLDASRNNPFSNDASNQGIASFDSSDGELLMVYATAPGGVALEGKHQNSPFTGALLKHIATPGIEVEQLFKLVRREVFKTTDGKQIPWSNSTFSSEFYFSK